MILSVNSDFSGVCRRIQGLACVHVLHHGFESAGCLHIWDLIKQLPIKLAYPINPAQYSFFFSFFIPWCRPQSYWLSHFQSLLYCSENNQLGEFSEELHSCSCQYEHSPCQLPPPCSVGEGSACAACAPDNHTRCGNCNPGFALMQGVCRPMVADSTENYLGFETDLQDMELGYLLQRADRRLEVHSSNSPSSSIVSLTESWAAFQSKSLGRLYLTMEVTQHYNVLLY